MTMKRAKRGYRNRGIIYPGMKNSGAAPVLEETNTGRIVLVRLFKATHGVDTGPFGGGIRGHVLCADTVDRHNRNRIPGQYKCIIRILNSTIPR